MIARRFIALLLGAVLVGCAPPAEEPEASSPPIQVRVTTVRRGAISDVVLATGQTAALSVVRLASPVAGRVTQLTVRPGDYLEKGAVAARVIPLENEAALHGFALLEQTGGLGPSERQLATRLQRDLAARDIPLYAPFAAVVAERLHNPDEQVVAGDVLVELFDPKSLYVLANVPVESASRVHPGLPVEVSGTLVATGEVAALVTSLDPQTLTAPVRVAVKTIEPPLLHAVVECRITLARHADALLIPRTAIVSSHGRDGVVMVANDGQAQARAVQLGLRALAVVEVTEGLSAGEVVLTRGQYALPDGTRITPISE